MMSFDPDTLSNIIKVFIHYVIKLHLYHFLDQYVGVEDRDCMTDEGEGRQ